MVNRFFLAMCGRRVAGQSAWLGGRIKQFGRGLLMACAVWGTASAQVLLPQNAAGAPPSAQRQTKVIWSMVNVNHTPQQGDAHLLEFAGGKVVLIDAGHYQPGKDVLVPFLRSKRITRIHQFFSTHPHKDHYQGIQAVLEAGIQVDQAFFNFPDKGMCDSEIPWGCDYNDLIATRDRLIKAGAEVVAAKAGMSFDYGANSQLQVLYAFDGINTPVGRTDINDLSLVIRLDQGPTRVLFTGDLNRAIGGWLAQSGKGLAATILKFPHHGTEGAAPDAFFDAVAPKIGMVPSPALLWCSDRSARMRKWIAQHRLRHYVNGTSGHVTVTIHGASIRVQTQNKKTLPCPAP